MDQWFLKGSTRSKDGIGMRFVVKAKEGASADYVDDTTVFTSMISQYFTPQLYKAQGYMDFISITESRYDLRDKAYLIETLAIS